MRQLAGYTDDQVGLVRDFLRDHRLLNESHTERVRSRRVGQGVEAASS
jgi:hypothetical protein